MILRTMNNKEIHNELSKDMENVLRKANYMSSTAFKQMLKRGKKEHTYFYEYISPMKNVWQVLIKVEKKYMSGSSVTAQVFRKDHLDTYIIAASSTKDGTSDDHIVQHYTKHFIERYRERFIKNEDISLYDTAKKILENNSYAWRIKDNDLVYATTTSGILFGKFEPIDYRRGMIDFTTFITYDMIKDHQADDTLELAELQKKYDELFEEFKSSSNYDRIF